MNSPNPHRSSDIVVSLVAAGLFPVLLYWFLWLRVPSVSVDEARALLAQTNSAATLVDIRVPEAFGANHVPGAVNWPYELIASRAPLLELPPALKGRELLVIDDGGWRGAFATRKLRALLPGAPASPPARPKRPEAAGEDASAHGQVGVRHVTGGMALWDTILEGKPSPAHTHPMSTLKQWVAVLTAFAIKPAHMALCLLLIIWLWPRRAADLLALRWGLVSFWLGEAACAVDYIGFGGLSDLWEYLHNFGMSVGWSFTAYALLEGVDRRIIKYSAAKERCAALSLCRACVKYEDVPCGLRRMFDLLIPASIVVAAMPLCSSLTVISYNVTILGALTNYSHLISSILFENWFCSGAAIALLGVSWLVLLVKREDPVTPSKILFAAALGPLSFGFFRLVLFSAYSDELLWASFWEEVTELLFVVSVGFVLWTFRDGLFAQPAPASSDLPGSPKASA